MLSGADLADAVGEALGRRVRHIDIPPWMFMRAVRVSAKRLGADLFFQSGLRHYEPEYALGTWEVGGPTTHVRDVAGVEPEDFLTIARRYTTGPDSRRTAANLIRQIWGFMLIGLVPMHRLDKFDRHQQHPQPAHPRLSGQSQSGDTSTPHQPTIGSEQLRPDPTSASQDRIRIRRRLPNRVLQHVAGSSMAAHAKPVAPTSPLPAGRAVR